MVRRLVADDSYGRVALARTVELREVDALPRAEDELAIAHGQRHRAPDEHRFHVRGAVALRMVVARVVRDRAFEGGEHVPLHVRVGVLVHEDARGRVRDRDRTDPVADLRARDRGLHAGRDVYGLLGLRRFHRELLVPNGHFSFIAGGGPLQPPFQRRLRQFIAGGGPPATPLLTPALPVHRRGWAPCNPPFNTGFAGESFLVAARSPAIRATSAGVAFPPLTTRTTVRPRTSTRPARTAASGAAPAGSTRSERRTRNS